MSSMSELPAQVSRTIRRYHLAAPGKRILAAVSGGPDSVALVHCLHHLRMETGFSVRMAHFNHRLRKSADTDERFVARLAASLNIPLDTARGDARRHPKKSSLEDKAREARLEFFCRLARRHKITAVALGHNRDDQAETVLMRLLRGSGLTGLRGILARRTLNGTVFIRPLIECSREEILAYLEENKLAFRQDPTNRDTRFLRNAVRRELLPLLEKKYNPRVRDVLAGLAEVAGTDYALLEDLAVSSAQGMVRRNPGGAVSVNLKKLEGLHPSLRRIVIRRTIAGIQGHLKKLTFGHLLEVEKLIDRMPRDSAVHLPHNLRVQKTSSCLRFEVDKLRKNNKTSADEKKEKNELKPKRTAVKSGF